jgi:Uma2 family endonuclease
MLWLGTFAGRNSGVILADNTTVILGGDTEVQPDGALFREPAPPGGARVREDDYVEGPPQLVVEVAASSASYDLHDKRHAYERAGVFEYIVWRTVDEQIDWCRLQDGAYIRIEPDARGIIESATFPGLWLHVDKMLAGDMAGVLAALDDPPSA